MSDYRWVIIFYTSLTNKIELRLLLLRPIPSFYSMKQSEIVQAINEIMDEVIKQGEIINDSFDEKALWLFKNELKIVRLFMSFVRTHKGDRGMRMPERIKALYNVAGAVSERIENISAADAHLPSEEEKTEFAALMANARLEWKKNYSKNLLVQFEKQLVQFNYSGIPPELMRNFFSSQSRKFEKIKTLDRTMSER